MDIRLTNTLTRTTDVFTSLKPGAVGMYVCGPTVYSRAHIGNLRAFTFADVLRRMFEANGYAVTEVMNITDVGHLVGDGDEGEDKLQMSADKQGKTAWDIAAEYTDLFLKDMQAMNVLTPHVLPKATDHIAEQIAMIEEMERKGFTYTVADGVYFDTSKLPEYGRLSGQKSEEKEEGARIGVHGEKRNPSDFALWKFSPEGAKRHMEWESPWGVGFPGWHIECSAMSEKYLGVPFDVHTGGEDHVAVHHENEIAQTMAARGVLEANWWLHNAHLMVDGGKMSKSLGNGYTVEDICAKGIEPLAFRYFVLGAHYRKPMNFTWEAVGAAQTALNRLVDAAREWDTPLSVDAAAVERFMTRVNDDLDTAGALAVLWDVVHDENMASGVKAATVLAMDEVLGLALEDVVARPVRVTEEAQQLLDERVRVRMAKDWAKSDALRDQLAAMGYSVEDTADGQRVREKR